MRVAPKRNRANSNAAFPIAPGTKRSGGLLAALFGGGGANEADDSADVASAAPAPQPKAVKQAPTAKSSNQPSIAVAAPQDANIVHAPPSEVYTAGFQSDAKVPDASRFTGNAVQFLSVVRFQTK